MNCPYCDDHIHPGAKFCPKCGLPLKEDATMMGAYVSDDAGISPWLIGGGVVAVLGIALTLGFVSARRQDRPVETVRREPVNSYRYTASMGTGLTGRPATPLSLPTPRSGRQAALPPFQSGSPARWAYTPPARTLQPVAPVDIPDPAPPPVPLRVIQMNEGRQEPTVTVVQQSIPEIPSLSFVPGTQPVAQWQQEASAAPAGDQAAGNGLGDFRRFGAPQLESGGGQWVFDPVHERWARRPGVRRRQIASQQGGTANLFGDSRGMSALYGPRRSGFGSFPGVGGENLRGISAGETGLSDFSASEDPGTNQGQAPFPQE